MKVILASTSTYKKALLDRLGVSFETVDPQVDEAPYKKLGLPPLELAQKLSQVKAEALAHQFSQDFIIASDQLVSFEEDILGKPGSKEKAISQLKKMRAKSHQLITSVTITTPAQTYNHTDVTTLTLRPLTDQQIADYVLKDQPVDCAGAYKLEKSGIALFSNIESKDHTAIVGLPLIFISEVLFKNNIPLFKPL